MGSSPLYNVGTSDGAANGRGISSIRCYSQAWGFKINEMSPSSPVQSDQGIVQNSHLHYFYILHTKIC